MEVILLERVEKLGQIGDVVNVKAGFARNFLLPRKKALRANEANRKAHYVMLEIDASSSGTVAELERQTQINEDVVRYMTIKVDGLEEGPTVMMRKQERDRERRGDREGGRDGGPRGDRGDRGDRPDRAPRRDREEEAA